MEYPKWIDHPTEEVAKTRDGKSIPLRILVKDAKEEEKFYPKAVPIDYEKVTKKEEGKPNWPPKKV